MERRVLYICTNSSAGMRHFSVSILKTIFETSKVDAYALVMSESGENNYFNDIPEMYRERVIFMKSPQGALRKIGTLLFPYLLYKNILRACERFQIDTIHFLTEDPCVSGIVGLLKKRYELYYTVHDFIMHDIQYRNKLHKLWYNWSHRDRVERLMDKIDHLVTSSKYQYELLVKQYPRKKIYYHPFPSLVTESIVVGEKSIPELQGKQDYFLFFGRVEKYKGIDTLYHVFEKSSKLQNELLVVAGKGNPCFDYDDLENVIWINRFIQDDEVKALFHHAKCVVFPYTSATQSGVFSFCFYFNKPVIASDIPFFREFTSMGARISLFNLLDTADLEEQLIRFARISLEASVENSVYEQIYSKQNLEQALLKLYIV